MQKPLVQLRQISRAYALGQQQVTALQEIMLQINYGECVAIMGPSGSGKSTLLHLLGCLDRPSTGEYWLDEQNVAGLNDTALAQIRSTKIGFVFQSFNLIPQLNVAENVQVPFLYRSPPPNSAEIEQQSIEALAQVGLSHRLHHLPSQLSGGEMQRVAIARALAIQPRLILADEPTGNLDSDNGQMILELFVKLNRQGTTLVIVTHDEQVAARCRRIVRLRDGRLVSDQILEDKR